VENSEASPLLRFATQKAERPLGGPAAHTLEGAAPLQTTPQQKGAPLRGGQRAFARIQREGASAPPAPTPRKYKNKNLAVDGGVGPAFVSECRAVRDRTERPQDEHGAMPPAPVYPKYAYGHSATGPRVMNPAFHLAEISRVAAAESGINR
jgi:hypothetical protein